MLNNASFLRNAKFGFDTAENEPEYGYWISLIFVSLIFGPDLRKRHGALVERVGLQLHGRRGRGGGPPAPPDAEHDVEVHLAPLRPRRAPADEREERLRLLSRYFLTFSSNFWLFFFGKL